MSADALQRNGRAAYDKGDYTKALEYYNRAVGRGDPSVKLLDSVSATHIKLGDLTAALNAAKKIINAGREDATGYIRAGQILVKMGKESAALNVYGGGLKFIKHVGAGFEKLKKLHNDLQAQLAPTNSLDPLTVLPRELAIAVLEFLSFRQMIAVCRVSKGWTAFIQSEPTLWSHLDFSGTKKKVRSAFVTRAINIARPKITKATLNRVVDFDRVFNSIMESCPLESLKLAENGIQGQNLFHGLQRADKLKEFIVSLRTPISWYMINQMIELRMSTLEILQYQSGMVADLKKGLPPMPRLKSLNIKVQHLYLAEPGLTNIAKSSPRLESLILHPCNNAQSSGAPSQSDLRSCTGLRHVDLKLCQGYQFTELLLPNSVKTLKLAVGYDLPLCLNPSEDKFLSWDLPLLEEVDLILRDANFDVVAWQLNRVKGDQKLSNLKSIRIEGAVIESGNDFGLPLQLRGLQHFGLPGCVDFKDTHVDILLRDAPKLESLDLSGTSITGVAVKSIVRAGHVKILVINRCYQVGGDAVAWASSTGLKVEAKDMDRF